MTLASVVAAVAVAPAVGSTVRLKRVNFGPNGYFEGSLIVAGGSGERNSITVRVDDGVAVVRDRTARLRSSTPRRCKRAGLHVVRCSAPAIPGVQVGLGSGNDSLVVSIHRGFAYPAIAGGSGHDRIEMRNRNGNVEGGRGHDVIVTDIGASFLFGGPGDDRMRGGGAGDYITGGSGDDVLHGGRGKDDLLGGDVGRLTDRRPPGRDALYGGSGDDSFHDGDRPGHIGPDKVVGGTGTDHVGSYIGRRKAVSVDLNRQGGDGQRGERDSLSRVEDLTGGAGDDRLIGDGDGNLLSGRLGDDFVRGRGGDDRIDAVDDDEVSGDRGDDTVRTAAWSRATVSCNDGEDVVVSDPTHVFPREEVGAGPLIASDCERLEGRNGQSSGAPTFTVDPTPEPMATSGDLTFHLLDFECCDHNFRLTRATSPFEELDARKADAQEVTVKAPPDVVAASADGPVTLRVVTYDTHSSSVREPDPLVWRFLAGPG